MAAFSIALSAWAVSTMTTQVMGAPPQADQLEPAAAVTQSGDVMVAAGPTRIVAGFRMEGSPEIEVVFGDTEQYRAHIDTFYQLSDDMRSARTEFTRYVQAALVAVSGQRGRCPADTLAPLYYRARQRGDRYRELGRKFETEHAVIRELHRYGETSGLTPDYRWKVNRAARAYRSALTDYNEMRIAFFDQLASELRARGCDTEALYAAGKDTPEPDVVALVGKTADTTARTPRRYQNTDPIIPASTITFFVDNTACAEAQKVYVDGVLLGEVLAESKAAFQALAGSHSLCIIESSDDAECGAAGTVRSSYVHDGWSIRLHCKRDGR